MELDERYRNDALSDLEAVEAELAELSEKRAGLEDRLDRLVVRAPAAGIVHELNVHTIGGVVKPGETLLSIVPQMDRLIVEGQVRPEDIDQVFEGMPARIRFTSFNTRTTPELPGHVSHVSPDQTGGQNNVEPHYKVRVKLAKREFPNFAGKQIVPGMPAEIMITSKQRTVLSYLAKPLTDQFVRAFRDE